MKKAAYWVVLIGCVFAVVVPCGSARGAPVTQTLTLAPGWNAVFLEVEPGLNPSPPTGCVPAAGRTSPEPCEIFGAVPGILSVWAWNPRTSTPEFIQNLAQLVPTLPYMLSWFPGQSSPVNNLHAIAGETAYLIHRDEGAAGNYSLPVTGQPAIPRIKWVSNSFNLVGFHLDRSIAAGAMPRYFDFFAASPAHYLVPAAPVPPGPEVYVLDNASGTWRKAVSTDRMQAGEAFWVYCKGASSFGGPLSVQLEQGTGLDFGTVLDQQVVVLRGEYTAGYAGENVKMTAGVRALTGDAASYGVYYGMWSQVPEGNGSSSHSWIKLYPSGPSLVVPEGGQSRLRLGAVRAGLAAGAAYETNVEIKDGLGVLILLPARVVGIGTAGLWVGSVVVDQVASKATAEGAAGTTTPVGSPFLFRIIVHVSDDGTPSLLREVVQLWKEGTWKPDPDNPGRMIVDQPGEFVLVANPDYLRTFANGTIPGLRGAALRDGQEVGRRISTAAFGFVGPQPSNAGSFASGSTLEFVVTLPPEDDTNPFLHLFHKEHGAVKSYEIKRTLRLQFQLDDPAGGSIGGVPYLGWGSNEVGGVFNETLGLQHASPADPSQPDAGDASYLVNVAGTFRLRRVSDVGRLWTP